MEATEREGRFCEGQTEGGTLMLGVAYTVGRDHRGDGGGDFTYSSDSTLLWLCARCQRLS